MEAGISSTTVEAYLTDLRDFSMFLEEQFPGVLPGRLEHEEFIAYLAELRDQGASDNTIARRWTSISLFMEFLVEEEMLEENPMEKLHRPTFRKQLPAVLLPEQVDALLTAPGEEDQHNIRDRAILEVLYATGARVSEVAKLRESFLDLDRGRIRLMGKGRKMREVFLGDQAIKWCEKYKKGPRRQQLQGDSCSFFFVSQKGGRLRRESVWRIFKKYLRKSGEVDQDVSPHVLRHSFATHMLQNGAGLREVQTLLGHSSISTTEVYTHLQVDDLRESLGNCLPRDQFDMEDG